MVGLHLSVLATLNPHRPLSPPCTPLLGPASSNFSWWLLALPLVSEPLLLLLLLLLVAFPCRPCAESLLHVLYLRPFQLRQSPMTSHHPRECTPNARLHNPCPPPFAF